MMPIDFWYSIGSTYSYLTIMRLKGIEEDTGIPFEWRPFSVRAIMLEMDNIPFANKPVKSRYMWRDLKRRADKYGIKAQVPAPYPLEQFDLANKVAIVGRKEGWCADYTIASYKRWFQEGLPAGSEPNLSASLEEIGQDPDRVIGLANSAEIDGEFAKATDHACSLGIFGSPTFVVDGEIFWGDDRLEDAISWFKSNSAAWFTSTNYRIDSREVEALDPSPHRCPASGFNQIGEQHLICVNLAVIPFGHEFSHV